MCGIFGYCGPEPVDMDQIRLVAKLAGYRGPYAFGFAWCEPNDDCWQVYKQVGALDEHLDTLDRVTGAVQVIGHARLATSGNFTDLTNNQPLVKDGLAIVHNGNVYNWRELIQQHDLTLQTANDSETLLHLLARDDLSTASIAHVMSQIDARSPHALLAAGADQMIAFRDRHPLYVHQEQTGGVYLGSRKMNDGGRLLSAGAQVFRRTNQ